MEELFVFYIKSIGIIWIHQSLMSVLYPHRIFKDGALGSYLTPPTNDRPVITLSTTVGY